MTDKESLEFQRKAISLTISLTISLLKDKLKYHQTLYKLTNHSKKKEKHLQNIKITQDMILSAYEVYDDHLVKE